MNNNTFDEEIKEKEKRQAAKAALEYLDDIPKCSIIGIGTGSTIDYFIDFIATMKDKFKGTVASSINSRRRLLNHGIPIFELNDVDKIDIYFDGADEFNCNFELIKGCGGSLTREKIFAASSDMFVCIVDSSKKMNECNKYVIPVEVIPIAQKFVTNQIMKLDNNCSVIYRYNFITDNGNIILDVHNFHSNNLIESELLLNNIPGVVCNGIFAINTPNVIIEGKHLSYVEKRIKNKKIEN